MSDIVLSASVRQNLLSLQSTAELLATTQNRLATGKKVNTALDNPTNYFTAQSLDNRASDINNLLDGVGNGVQVLQAANTGITSLQKLVDTAKSIANQALQAAVGYSSKSAVTTTAITGATADDLRGTVAPLPTQLLPLPAPSMARSGCYTNTARAAGTQLSTGTSGAVNATATSLISALTDGTTSTAPVNGDNIVVNGVTLTFVTSGAYASVDSTTLRSVSTRRSAPCPPRSISISGNTTNASNATGGQL